MYIITKYWVLFLLLILSSACNPSKKSKILSLEKRKIKFQLVSIDKKPWDPGVTFSTKAHLQSALFGQLLNFDNKYKIKPGIIKSWVWDRKSKSYTFKINDKLTYDQNRKLRVEDIEFAILKNFLSNNQEADRRLLKEIKGIKKIKIGDKFTSGMCEGIKIIDKNTFQIFLVRQNPVFLYILGDLASFVAPPEDFTSDMFTFNNIPRGTGKYEVIWSDPKSSTVSLKRKTIYTETDKNYPIYIDFIGHGDGITNNVDIAIGASARKIKKKDKENKYSFISNPTPRIVQVIDFNYSTALGSDLNFRQMISLALDSNYIFNDKKHLKECHELVPEGYYGRTNDPLAFDPKKAKKIKEQYFPKIATKSSPINAYFHGKSNWKKLPNYIKKIKEQLENVGVYINFQGSLETNFSKLKGKNFIFGTYGTVTSFIDPLAPFELYIEDDSNYKDNTLTNKKDMKKLLKLAQESLDNAERAKHIQKLSKYFQKNIITLPLHQRGGYYAYKNNIKIGDLNNTFFALNFDNIEILDNK